MSDTFIQALIWGAAAGYLLLNTLTCLLAGIFCLHAILMTRWKRLAKKVGPGQVKYANNLRLLFGVILFGTLFTFLLFAGDNLLRGNFHFRYQGTAGLVWGISAALAAGFFLRKAWRRLVFIWRMSHEVGYAEKQRRTSVLKR